MCFWGTTQPQRLSLLTIKREALQGFYLRSALATDFCNRADVVPLEKVIRRLSEKKRLLDLKKICNTLLLYSKKSGNQGT